MILNWLRLLLAIFAIYRLSSLIALEEGPAGIFQLTRVWAGAYNLAENGQPETYLGRGISCPLCVGVYVSLVILPMVVWPFVLTDFFLLWMALAGAQTFLQRIAGD